jgi:hypothetical protein
MGGKSVPDPCGTGQRPVAGCCKHSNGLLVLWRSKFLLTALVQCFKTP